MRTFSMAIGGKRLAMAIAAFICCWASAGVALADGILWYNGDLNGNAGTGTLQLANEQVTPSQYNYVYDDFIVPAGQTWTIDSVYSNDQLSAGTTVTQAYWEIRSGVSSGDGGTLVPNAYGTGAATQTATGRTGTMGTEYTIAVSGLDITLTAGTYWLTVAPLDTATNNSFISATIGLNAVGMPPGNDDNSFLTSTIYGTNFEPASDYIGYPADFSMGVSGTIPEPSTFVMGSIGALGVLGSSWRSRSCRDRTGGDSRVVRELL